jgi:hypothetical protein
MWDAWQLSRTVSLPEVLLVILAAIGVPMHLWGWHDALLDEGAILAGARNTPAGAVLLRLARGHARSEMIRLAIKAMVLSYAVAAMGYPSGPFSPWSQLTLLIVVLLLTGETWLQRWDRRRMMLGNARVSAPTDGALLVPTDD